MLISVGNGILKMAISLTGVRSGNNRAVESAEQDQTACMCRLILFYTLR